MVVQTTIPPYPHSVPHSLFGHDSAPGPLIPMVLIGKSRKFKNATAADSADRVATRQQIREHVFKKSTFAALRALFATQIAELPANALPNRVVAALDNANALYAANIAAAAAGRSESWPCALWQFKVIDCVIHDYEFDKAELGGCTQRL